MVEKAVLIVSGGLDSVTMLHKAHVEFPHVEIHAVSFDYGQRHVKELDYAMLNAQLVGAEHHVVDLSSITGLIAQSGSSLVSDTDVPEGHYGEESMRATVVPNRNMTMLSIAGALAVSIEADVLGTGVHAGDHFIYPDCRPKFVNAFEQAFRAGNEGFLHLDFALWTPFLFATKNDIAAQAFTYNVPIESTWSCYKGGDLHCGKCGTCVERIEAIASTGKNDPTTYEDEEFWKEALKRATV